MSKVRRDGDADGGHWIAVGTAFVAACTAIWLSKVSEIVPDPYLVSSASSILNKRSLSIFLGRGIPCTTSPGLLQW